LLLRSSGALNLVPFAINKHIPEITYTPLIIV